MASLFTQIITLIRKDLLLEWRQKYAVSGIFLYIISTVMVVYLSFTEVKGMVWVSLLWIILLFASVNAVAKSFMQEPPSRQLYYYTVASPQAIIIAKLVYNVFLLLLLAAIGVGVFSLVIGNPIRRLPLFFGVVALGAASFSMCFTLISAIAAKAGRSATLMPILSFPIILPILGLLVQVSKTALIGMDDVNMGKDLGILLALNGILWVLSLVLFPFLWRD